MRSELIHKLKAVLNNSTETTVDTYEGLHSTITVNEKASEQDIEGANSYFNYAIPADYLSFLQVFDGGTFFKVEDIGGLEFFSCSQLIENNEFQKDSLEDDWRDDIILFSSCLGDGDFIGFEVRNDGSYDILDCFHEVLPSEWKSIGHSFDDFLEKFIDSKGEKFWLGIE